MRYPGPDEYMKAVQQPDSFTVEELRRMSLVLHPRWGVPTPASGTSAVVFKAMRDGEPQALRFFTREDAWSGAHYTALHDHFANRDLRSCVAMPRWVDDGIRVNGRTWPVVCMQWVDGLTLNGYVDGLVRDRDVGSLGSMARSWRQLVVRLQRAEFAHGDLQHGNILVDSGGTMRLVDFDCSWIAGFADDREPGESGHRNYQLDNRPWGRWMDTFPGLVIYLSLLALSRNPDPWRTLHTGENLLFQHGDFRPPFHTPTWQSLSSLRDNQVDDLAGRLQSCCTDGRAAGTALDELLAPREKVWWEIVAPRVPGSPSAPPAAPVPPVRQPIPPAPQPVPAQPWTPPRPTVNWWAQRQHQPVPGRPVPGKRSVVKVGALALALGYAAMILTGGIAEGADAEMETMLPIAVVVGVVVAVIVVVVGFRRNR